MTIPVNHLPPLCRGVIFPKMFGSQYPQPYFIISSDKGRGKLPKRNRWLFFRPVVMTKSGPVYHRHTELKHERV